MLQNDRHRRGRAHRTAPHLLRDARQLLGRRLLQGRRGRPRVGVRHRAHAPGPRAPVGDRVRRRSGAGTGRGRSGRRCLGADRHSARADHAAPALGELLAGRSDGPVRAVLGALLRPRGRARLRPARLRAGLRVRPVPRVLEPRLHGVRPRRRRHADAASEPEHRHRPRRRARRRRAPGRPLGVRDGRLPARHGLGCHRDRDAATGSPTSPRRRTACSPTTAAR